MSPPVFKPGFSTVGESSSSASSTGTSASSVVDVLVERAGDVAATVAAMAVAAVAEFAAGVLSQRLFVGLLDLPLKFYKYSY
jgi:hypothetical protein